MKYIDQVNLFNSWTEVNQLSPTAQLLWFKLMHLSNCAYWAPEVKVSNVSLMGHMNITSPQTLARARDELVSNGLIDYEKGVYRIKELVATDCGIKMIDRDIDEKVDSLRARKVPKRQEPKPATEEKQNKPAPKKKAKPRIPYGEIETFWNEHHGEMPSINGMTGERKRKIRTLLNNGHTIDQLKTVILKAEKSSFMNGNGKGEWKANFDWILKPQNFQKILEGNYDDGDKPKSEQKQPKTIIDPNEDLYAMYR